MSRGSKVLFRGTCRHVVRIRSAVPRNTHACRADQMCSSAEQHPPSADHRCMFRGARRGDYRIAIAVRRIRMRTPPNIGAWFLEPARTSSNDTCCSADQDACSDEDRGVFDGTSGAYRTAVSSRRRSRSAGGATNAVIITMNATEVYRPWTGVRPRVPASRRSGRLCHAESCRCQSPACAVGIQRRRSLRAAFRRSPQPSENTDE